MRLLIGLVLIAFVAVWWWLLPRRSGSRMWSPIWLAFTTTVAAAVFTVAGGIGYTLSRHTRFVRGTAWSGSVIWWQVGVGLAFVLLAAYFWRRAVRDTGGQPEPGATSR